MNMATGSGWEAMSVSNIDQVLAQMRSMTIQASGSTERVNSDSDSDTVNFSGLLKQSIDDVNKSQLQADEMTRSFELGSKDVNLAEVMVAVQKSNISFEAMLQVRNKLTDAYKEVMNMPI